MSEHFTSGELTKDEKARLFMTLDEQSAQLRELKLAVYGNETAGFRGLVSQMRDVTGYIAKQNLQKAKIIGFCSAIVLLIKWGWEALLAYLHSNNTK